MRRYWIILAFPIILRLVAAGTASGANNHGADAPVAARHTAQGDWHNVRRLRIEYDTIPADDSRLSVHRVLALAAPDRFYFLAAHFNSSSPWQTDPVGQEYVITGGKTYLIWTGRRMCKVGTQSPSAEIGGTLGRDNLMAVLPMWPLTYPGARDGKGRSILPTEALASGTYALSKRTQVIRNEECLLFEYNQCDRLWVAKHKGNCVIRRELCDPLSGSVLERFDVKQIREIAANCWVPVEVECAVFAAGPSNPDGPLVRHKCNLHVLCCDINDQVPDSVFVPTLPPGTLTLNARGDIIAAQPGGEDLLDEVSRVVHEGTGDSLTIPGRSALSTPFLSGVALGGLIAAGATAVATRFRRHKAVAEHAQSVADRDKS